MSPLQVPLTPAVWFDQTDLRTANDLLTRWEHRMGPVRRPMESEICHVLVSDGSAVAVTVTSSLIRERVGGGLPHLNRLNSVELARLCAARPGLCRVAIRLWREFVFPKLGARYAISYQDADLHNGATYRFDGWGRSPRIAHSGTDTRSGRPGRDKWVWVWPKEGALARAEEAAA